MAEQRPTTPSLRKPATGAASQPAAPKNIDLRKRQMSAAPPPPELMQRVTSTSLPPRRQPLETVEQQLPLMAGETVMIPQRSLAGRSFENMTEFEQRTLLENGYEPGMPLPKNALSVLRAAQTELGLDKPPVANVDPRQAPVKIPEAIPFAKRPPEAQAQIRRALENAMQIEQAAIREAEEANRFATLPPSVGEAAQLAEAMAAEPSQDEVEIDIQPSFSPPPPPPPPPAAASVRPQPVVDDTGAEAGAKPVVCGMCGHPSHLPAVPEPTREKKLAFLQTVLGEVNFKDVMVLMGGNLEAVFRTLTVKELQQVFRQAHQDAEKKRISTTADYYERLNWYRLCLQLVSLRSTAVNGFTHVFPEGLSASTNSLAVSYWDCDEPTDEDTELLQISDYFENTILKTETMVRLMGAACNQFNRLVAKMEANLENSDFWKPTDGQS